MQINDFYYSPPPDVSVINASHREMLIDEFIEKLLDNPKIHVRILIILFSLVNLYLFIFFEFDPYIKNVFLLSILTLTK